MKLHDLEPSEGSRKKRKRVGRGISAGQGKTAGRGTKGQGARAGSGGHLYRQGGNLPFFRRLPFKRGFSNVSRITWNEINLDQLEGLEAGVTVTPDLLQEAGLLKDPRAPVVLLGRGEAPKALEVHVHRASKSAAAKMEAAGSKVFIIEPEPDPSEAWAHIQVGDLRAFDKDAIVTPEALAGAGLIEDTSRPVALHGRGDLHHPLVVRVHRVSHAARARVLAAGGKVEPLEAPAEKTDAG